MCPEAWLVHVFQGDSYSAALKIELKPPVRMHAFLILALGGHSPKFEASLVYVARPCLNEISFKEIFFCVLFKDFFKHIYFTWARYGTHTCGDIQRI